MNQAPLTEERLVGLLEEVAPRIAYPPTPDLATRVRERIRTDEVAVAPAPVPWFRRPVLVAFVIVVVGATASLFLSTTARRAVADLLGVIGIEIEFGDPDTSDLPPPDLDTLDLGARVGVGEAEAAVGFELRGPAVGGASETYLDPAIGETGMVSTLFRAKDLEVSYLVTEFRGSVEAGFLKKVAAGDRTEVVGADVGQTVGYWLSGKPHYFAYVGADGLVREESVRLAGNVLLWSQAGVTYRIEGAARLAEALRIAAEMGFE